MPENLTPHEKEVIQNLQTAKNKAESHQNFYRTFFNERNIGRRVLAEYLDLSTGYVSNILSGYIRMPRKIADKIDELVRAIEKVESDEYRQ